MPFALIPDGFKLQKVNLPSVDDLLEKIPGFDLSALGQFNI
jgi:hypothetical protein